MKPKKNLMALTEKQGHKVLLFAEFSNVIIRGRRAKQYLFLAALNT